MMETERRPLQFHDFVRRNTTINHANPSAMMTNISASQRCGCLEQSPRRWRYFNPVLATRVAHRPTIFQAKNSSDSSIFWPDIRSVSPQDFCYVTKICQNPKILTSTAGCQVALTHGMSVACSSTPQMHHLWSPGWLVRGEPEFLPDQSSDSSDGRRLTELFSVSRFRALARYTLVELHARWVLSMTSIRLMTNARRSCIRIFRTRMQVHLASVILGWQASPDAPASSVDGWSVHSFQWRMDIRLSNDDSRILQNATVISWQSYLQPFEVKKVRVDESHLTN